MNSEQLLHMIAKAARNGDTRLDLNCQRLTVLPGEIAQLAKLTYLNLCGNQLTTLPREIGQLINLKELDLGKNQLTTLPREIGQLINLKELDLSKNQLTTLPREIGQLINLTLLNLSNNQLAELPDEIGQLSHLKELDLSKNQLIMPSGIAQLINLKLLNLSNNKLVKLPGGIAQLINLKLLNLSNNQLTALPPETCQFTNLGWLDLSGNQLKGLPPEIAQLTKITWLNLSDNQLMAVPPQIGQLTNLENLNLYLNPLLNSPPPEIVNQGLQAILTYLQKVLQGSQRQWNSKLLVVGQGGVGKTALLKVLRGEAFNNQESTTHGIEIKSLKLAHPVEAGVTMQLNTWDFGGQEIYHATHLFFLTNRSLFLLVWNVRHGFEQGKLYYWLDTIKALAPESPVLLVATHIDQRDADLPLTELRRNYPQIVGQCEISSKTGMGVEALRQAIREVAAELPLMGEKWPITWLSAANAIRSMPEKYITPQQLWQIMDVHGLDDAEKQVLTTWLHELGDILYFPENEELNDTVILKPQWVTKYISKVLISEEVINNSGIFTRIHMDQLWHDLAPSMRDYFLRLMERFDLSYRILSDQDMSLVVARLPLDPPDYEQKWNHIKQTDECKEISMKFQLSTIPAGIPTWFIARQHRFTTNIHWRNGALFAYGPQQKHLAYTPEQEHLALVQAFPHERYIQLIVRGPNPLNFFMLLKDGIEVTLARFPGLQIQRKIPCVGHNGQSCPHEFDYDQLLKRYQKKKLTIECPEAMKDVLVTELLYDLNSSTRNTVLDRIDQFQKNSDNKFFEQINPLKKFLEHHLGRFKKVCEQINPLKKFLEHIDQLEKKIVAGQNAILDELKNERELRQREFTNAFRREQAKIDSHCPNVFVLRPRDGKDWKKAIAGQKIDLQLYCQAPGCWHPTQEGGLYEIDEPAEWLRATAPYIHRLIRVLKLAAPIVGPWLGVVDPKDYEKLWKNDLELFKEVAEKVPELKESEDLELAGIARGEDSEVELADGAALRALRQLLEQKDPQQHWGGLKKVLTPEGHFLWLCEHHAAQYKR